MANGIIIFIKIIICGPIELLEMLLVIVIDCLVEAHCRVFFERCIHLAKKMRQNALNNN